MTLNKLLLHVTETKCRIIIALSLNWVNSVAA